MSNMMLGLVAIGAIGISMPVSSIAQSDALVITSEPQSQTVAAGSAVSFSVEAASSTPLTYQWYFNGLEISGATDSSYVISAVTTNDAGEYLVNVMDDVTNVLSQIAVLTVTEEPVPSGPPILDFNNDGNADLLWVHSDGRIIGWLMDGTNHIGSVTLPYRAPSGWKPAGQADFDLDGKVDFLWQHGNGRIFGWTMDGTNRLGTFNFSRRASGGWKVVGLSDFDANGSTDILWQHGNGRVAAWMMEGTNFVSSAPVNGGDRAKGGWKIAGLLDLDEDGDKDILWQHGGGRLAVWYLDGVNVTSNQNFRFSGKTTSSWRVAGVCDLDGDGQSDLIWRHADGYLRYWLMNGTMEPEVARPKNKKVGKPLELHSK